MSLEQQPFLADEDVEHSTSYQLKAHTQRPQREGRQSTWIWVLIVPATSISIFCNIVLSWLLYTSQQQQTHSPYASLARDLVSQFNYSSKYGLSTQNEAARSVLWESFDTGAGEISLPKTWAAERGLPSATTFWWDDSRSVYLVNGYHSLHCLRKLRRSIVLSHHNMSQMDPYPHLVHCMDHLLQNILCEADDTPMYTSPTRDARTGHGQRRMCRSWGKLEAWVSSQPSCFAFINETQGVEVQLERFRYCPNDTETGRTADTAMRAHFGLPSSFNGQKPKDIDSIPRYWESFLDEDE